MLENQLKRKIVLITISIFILNFLLKFLYISSRDVAGDELFTLFYAQTEINTILDMLYNENNPPFHFLFMHFWVKVFGIGEMAVRIPSVIFSALTAVVLFRTGNRFYNPLVGIGAALIFSFSSMHVFFSHEARVYPLFCLLTACALYLFLKINEDPFRKKNYALLLLVNVLLIYSHYFGFFVIMMQVISFPFLKNWKQTFKPMLITLILLGLSYIPMLVIFLHRFGNSTVKGTWVAAPGFGEIYGNLNRFLNSRINTLVIILLFVIIIASLFKQKTLKSRVFAILKDEKIKIITSWFLVPYVLMFALSFKYPMFIDRYILYTSIPFYLLLTVLISQLVQSTKHIGLIVSVFLISMLVTLKLDPDNNRRLKQAAEVVKALKNKTNIVFIAPDHAYMGFSYYFAPEYFKLAPKTLSLLEKDNVFPITKRETALEIIANNSTDTIPDCIYFQAGSEFMDPDNLIFKTLSEKYKHRKTQHVFEIYDIHHFYN